MSESQRPHADCEARWHRIPGDAALEILRSSGSGLEAAEAAARRAVQGPNTLPVARRTGLARMVLAQFADVLIVVLLVAAAVSAAMGEATDAAVILAIVVLNAVVGVVQEFRAERALEALRELAAPTATVLRGGTATSIAAADLVPGDVVALDAGRIVPADLRLLQSAGLCIDEAVLTGESVPVDKDTLPLAEGGEALGDRNNLAYSGTIVTRGRGRGVVFATGQRTELGRIARLVASAEAVKTPLQKRLARFARRLAIAVIAICATLFVLGVARGEAPFTMFLTAVSLAVAAVPEALPAVVTIALALGARRMARRHALVRTLPAVEALGSVTVICSDKTGTLTENRMRVAACHAAGRTGALPTHGAARDAILRAMFLCNDARRDGPESWTGDPTEIALARAAGEAGIDAGAVGAAFPRIGEIAFDASRKRMTTLHEDPSGGALSFTKGAPEIVVPRCDEILAADGLRDIDREALLRVADRMAASGWRVLALASREWPEGIETVEPEEVERGLLLLGLVGLADPPRPGAREAVRECRAAGIVPVMITGDHPATACAVAREVGLLEAGDAGRALMTGDELAALSEGELERRIGDVRVFARVVPEQKLAIVMALQRRGEIVAMTGDGVNDAPALKRADVGVAMGRQGTDVAKESSALVLLDDRFETIVHAVADGRTIYDNIRKFVRYILTTNSAELWTIAGAPVLGLPIPLLPIQILWMNLVTDGLPSLALATERAESDVMSRPPRPPQESVLAAGLGRRVVVLGLVMAALVLGMQAWLVHEGNVHARTAVFTFLCALQLAAVLSIRSERPVLAAPGPFANKPLLLSVAVGLAGQAAVVYVPLLNRIFGTQPLGATEIGIVVVGAAVVFASLEVEKVLRTRRVARAQARSTAATVDPPGTSPGGSA